jgi:hypothetical protein
MSDNPKLKAWTIMLVAALVFLFVYLYQDNRQHELNRRLEREKMEIESLEREKDRQLMREKIKHERELQGP